MIIDPGSDIDHISEGFCKRAYIRTKPALYKVQQANKSTMNMIFTRNKVKVSVWSCSESFRMGSNPLNWDIVLGEKCCSTHKASIDSERNMVRIVHRHKKFIVWALANSDSEISVIKIELKDEAGEVFAIALKSPDQSIDSTMHKDIGNIIHEYCNVFPDKLLKGLRTSRGNDFVTELYQT